MSNFNGYFLTLSGNYSFKLIQNFRIHCKICESRFRTCYMNLLNAFEFSGPIANTALSLPIEVNKTFHQISFYPQCFYSISGSNFSYGLLGPWTLLDFYLTFDGISIFTIEQESILCSIIDCI